MKIEIINWSELYENSESRRYQHLKWVPVPNKHDGAGFRRLAADSRRFEIFSAWVLILQLASRHEKDRRGTLDVDFEDLEFKTGFPANCFELAISFLSDPKIGWIKIVEPAADLQQTFNKPAGLVGLNRTEQNRNEKKEREGKNPTLSQVSEYCKTNNLKIDPSKFWNYYEAIAWMKNGVEIQDWKALLNLWESRETQTQPQQATKKEKVRFSSLSQKQVLGRCSKREAEVYGKYTKNPALNNENFRIWTEMNNRDWSEEGTKERYAENIAVFEAATPDE